MQPLAPAVAKSICRSRPAPLTCGVLFPQRRAFAARLGVPTPQRLSWLAAAESPPSDAQPAGCIATPRLQD